jgi:hypothetical protein
MARSILAGGRADNHYWAYGKDAEKIREEKDGGTDTLWYMAGPDDYVLHCPPNVEKIRIATVVSRSETDVSQGKRIRIVAHPDSPIEFETSERVEIDLRRLGRRRRDDRAETRLGDLLWRGGQRHDDRQGQSRPTAATPSTARRGTTRSMAGRGATRSTAARATT